MKKLTMAAVMALGLFTAGTAFAKAVTGTITQINTKSDSITLAGGETFKLPEGIEAEKLRVGEKVVVTYSTTSGKVSVSSVRKVQ